MVDFKLIDTHAHLDMNQFNKDREEVIARADNNQIAIANMAVDLDSSEYGIKLAKENLSIYAGIGFHPHEATRYNSKAEKCLCQLASQPEVVAIGEIGLDFYRNHSPRDEQKSAFSNQLNLAKETDLPVIIHNRSATDDLLETLDRFDRPPRGIFHSFFGDFELAEILIGMGYYLGTSGPITYSNNSELRQTIKKIPLEKIVLETDCPFLTPQPHRGKRNEPTYVQYVAKKIAEVKSLPAQEVAKQTTNNAKRILGL